MFGKKKKETLGEEGETPGGDTPGGDTPGGETPGGDSKDSGKADDGKSSEVGQMKPGDYMIHVFIEKAKKIKMPEKQDVVDPIFEVKVIEEKKFTSAKDDISNAGVCTWNEHLFFEPKNLTVDKLEQAKISIRLMDKGYFKETLLGLYEFDLAYIYFQQKHSLLHKWIALSNPDSETFNEVAAYIKLSISVTTVGDEQIQITDDTNADSEDILMPPSIRPEYYQIRFKFFRAERLPAMDRSLTGKGSIDAYLMCTYMNTKLRTDVITTKEGDCANWNCEFLVPCQLPIMSGRVVMKVMDQDLVKDEIVGSLLFNLKDCIDDKKLNGRFFWKNIYGAPLDKSGANTDLMNSSPESASTWKGRILMQVSAQKTEKPVCIKRALKEEDVTAAEKYLMMKEFEIIAEVGQGLALPDAGKYKVMIKIGELELKTEDPKIQQGHYNRWSHRFPQQTYKAPYKDLYDIGKVFFYLLKGKDPICFYKADIEEFKNPNPDWKWIQLNPDLSMGKVKDAHKAGLISVKLSIHHKDREGPIDFKGHKAWEKDAPKRLGVKKVRAYIFQCRDIPAADSDGQSDPFIKIWDTTNDEKKTRIIEDNNNPLFYETVELTMESGADVEQMSPLIMDVYDYDTLGNDFICRAVIPIKDAAYIQDSDKVVKPKWHQCKLKPDSPAQGEILVSFAITELDYQFKAKLPKQVNLAAEVPRKEFVLDINILGLRDLQSAGILPVKKAFIVFNLKSLVPPDDGRAIENIKTAPSAAGPNPTINTLIQFRVPLPVDKLFQPRLLCTVHDYIFKGFNQPLLGSFIIPVGDLIDKLAEERHRETAAIENIINELDKIIRGEGIQTYAIQNNSPITDAGFEEHTEAASRRQSERKQSQARKATVRVDDEMKQPLLLNAEYLESEDVEEEKMDIVAMMTSPRTRKLSNASNGDGKKRRTTNVMKSTKPDKTTEDKVMLIGAQREIEEKQKRELEDKRIQDAQNLKNTLGANSAKNVILPSYGLDKRLNVDIEVSNPPETLFLGLGWDATPGAKTRHYRRFYPTELEKCTEIMPVPTPFEAFDLKRGQSRGASKGMWPFGGGQKQDASGEVSTEQVVGRFKGTVTVQTEEDKKEYDERKAELIHNLKIKLNALSLAKVQKPLELKLEKMDTMEGRQKFEIQMEELGVSHLQITKQLANLESDETLKRLLMSTTKCVVRVYIVDAFNLSSRDNGSESDPYLIVKCGNRTYNQRDKYQSDEPNPKFNSSFDFEAIFPGCAPLVITVMDYDEIFGDESIGVTSIDLEDRFFSPEWQSIKNKPIEHRQIYHPSSAMGQGTVRLWVEIHPTSIPMSEVPLWDLTPKPYDDFEMRVVIFDTKDVIADDPEGCSDVYCRTYFDSNEEVKETDTHYRCGDGKASFNYRMLFNVKYPRKDYNFTVQLYDRDLFSGNDLIGETTFSLKEALTDAALTKKQVSITKKYYNSYLKECKSWKNTKIDFKDENSFWLTCKNKGEDGKEKVTGKVRVQIDILPKEFADKNKVGEARQEPNHSPTLPPPEGRLSLEMNPIKMMLQLIGPDLKRKIICWMVIAFCCFLCIMLIPLVAGNLISAGILSIFGL